MILSGSMTHSYWFTNWFSLCVCVLWNRDNWRIRVHNCVFTILTFFSNSLVCLQAVNKSPITLTSRWCYPSACSAESALSIGLFKKACEQVKDTLLALSQSYVPLHLLFLCSSDAQIKIFFSIGGEIFCQQRISPVQLTYRDVLQLGLRPVNNEALLSRAAEYWRIDRSFSQPFGSCWCYLFYCVTTLCLLSNG